MQRKYGTTDGSGKSYTAPRRGGPLPRLPSFEEVVERETYDRCMADMSRRITRSSISSESGIPRMYSSTQRLPSPRYRPTFERSLSSSQLPRGDYGYIRSVKTPPTKRYSNPFPAGLMVRQRSEPGISVLYVPDDRTSVKPPKSKSSRSVEALVSPTPNKRSSPLFNRKTGKPSRTRTSHSLEAINEPTGNQKVQNQLIMRSPSPRKSSTGKPGGNQETLSSQQQQQHTAFKAKIRPNTSLQRGKTVDKGTKPTAMMKKSASMDAKICNRTSSEKEKKTRMVPKSQIVSVTHTEVVKDQNDNDSHAVFKIVARAPCVRKGNVPKATISNDKNTDKQDSDKTGNGGLNLERDLPIVPQQRSVSNSQQQSDEDRRMSDESVTVYNVQGAKRISSSKIPVPAKTKETVLDRTDEIDSLVAVVDVDMCAVLDNQQTNVREGPTVSDQCTTTHDQLSKVDYQDVSGDNSAKLDNHCMVPDECAPIEDKCTSDDNQCVTVDNEGLIAVDQSSEVDKQHFAVDNQGEALDNQDSSIDDQDTTEDDSDNSYISLDNHDTASDNQCIIADDQDESLDDLDNTSDSQDFAVDNQDTSLDNQDNTSDNQDFAVDDEDYTVDNLDNTVDNEDTSVDNQDFTVDNQDNTVDNQDFTVDNKDFTVDIQDASLDSQDFTIVDSQDFTVVDNQDFTVDNLDNTVDNPDNTVDNPDISVDDQDFTVDNDHDTIVDNQDIMVENQDSSGDNENFTVDNEDIAVDSKCTTEDSRDTPVDNPYTTKDAEDIETGHSPKRTDDSTAVSNTLSDSDSCTRDAKHPQPPQDLFSGLDMSKVILPLHSPHKGRMISPPKTLLPLVSSGPPTMQQDRRRRERMEMVIETNPPRLSLRKQVRFKIQIERSPKIVSRMEAPIFYFAY